MTNDNGLMKKYNFDKIINRKGTNAMSVEGFKEYLFDNSELLQLPCKEEELIPMWVADMEFETVPEVVEAIQRRAEHGILGYTKLFDGDYKQTFLNWAKSRYDYQFNQNHLVTSSGVIPALYDLVQQLCNDDEKVLIFTPSYAYFKHATDYHHIELVTSDLIQKEDNFYINFEDVRQKVKDEKLRLCIFCNPHNPTGRLWTAQELRQLGELCFENQVTIISDEIHCDLLRSGKTFIPFQKVFSDSEEIITCMAPSKTFNLAGLLFAYIIIPNEEQRLQWHQHHLSFENPLSIVAAQAAYQYGEEWLEELKIYLDQNFDFLQNYLTVHLPKAKFSIPEATYLAWIDLTAYFPPNENLTLFFANQAGVLLEGGNMFVDNAAAHIRLNLACPQSRLKEGLKRIVKVIDE